MKTVVKILNKILSWLPGNGQKTVSGFVLLGAAYLLKEYFGVETSHEQLTGAFALLVQAQDLIIEALSVLGVSLAGLGLTHKAGKVVEKKLKGQWER